MIFAFSFSHFLHVFALHDYESEESELSLESSEESSESSESSESLESDDESLESDEDDSSSEEKSQLQRSQAHFTPLVLYHTSCGLAQGTMSLKRYKSLMSLSQAASIAFSSAASNAMNL